MKNVLIVSYVPVYNRQGFDLHECLRRAGHNSRLLQLDAQTDNAKNIVGVKQTKPHGVFHTVHVFLNVLRFLAHSLFITQDVIVAVGRPALPIAWFLKKFSKAKVVYYALEYSVFSGRDKAVVSACVDKIIDVEENRLSRLMRENGLSSPTMVVHNMPHRHKMPMGGALRKYLVEKHKVSEDAKIAIYAGSYQSYACVGQILEAARGFGENRYVVFMTFNLPRSILGNAPANVIVAPPVAGDAFYDWLYDADCALLPYESTTDFNVQFCSPQKLYDCYLAGVPYVASARPIVRLALGVEKNAGRMCDFTNAEEIMHTVENVFAENRDEKRQLMRALHIDKFNYDIDAAAVARFVTT